MASAVHDHAGDWWADKFSSDQREAMQADDSQAWSRVTSILIAVVCVGTLMMGLTVLACL